MLNKTSFFIYSHVVQMLLGYEGLGLGFQSRLLNKTYFYSADVEINILTVPEEYPHPYILTHTTDRYRTP